MIPDVADRTDDLKRLCVRFNVLRLDLFGSAASGDYHAQGSDLDFVVEFQPRAYEAYADTYFWSAGSAGTAFRKACGPYRRFGDQESLLPAVSR